MSLLGIRDGKIRTEHILECARILRLRIIENSDVTSDIDIEKFYVGNRAKLRGRVYVNSRDTLFPFNFVITKNSDNKLPIKCYISGRANQRPLENACILYFDFIEGRPICYDDDTKFIFEEKFMIDGEFLIILIHYLVPEWFNEIVNEFNWHRCLF